MLEWLFNISIISLLIILIFHYAFDFFAPNKSIVDLKVQKYKNIIDTMVQQQKETEFKKAYEKETGEPLLTEEEDGLEDLELYIRELAVSA
jgi:hypothetical protein